MPLLYSLIGIVAWQAIVLSLYHFGELDSFWTAVIEIFSVAGSCAAFGAGWVASVDWSK